MNSMVSTLSEPLEYLVEDTNSGAGRINGNYSTPETIILQVVTRLKEVFCLFQHIPFRIPTSILSRMRKALSIMKRQTGGARTSL
jgi:hypothetical protein